MWYTYIIYHTKIKSLQQNKEQNPIHFHPFASKAKKWGTRRKKKKKKQYSHPSLSFRKTEEKEWERGMRKRKGAKLLWALLGPLQPHAEETNIEVNGELLNSFKKSSLSLSSSSFNFRNFNCFEVCHEGT